MIKDIKSPFDYKRYLFVFAHPDDEIYTCVFIAELVRAGKSVDIVYVTSGDYNGADVAVERELELSVSMKVLGIKSENVHLIRIPERQLMDRALEARNEVAAVAKKINPDCIVGHDFEGGHNGHDLVSFFASYVAKGLGASFFVFPAYHGWPENRQYNQFILAKDSDYKIEFSEDQKQLQKSVLSAHKTQTSFMALITSGASYDLFSSRELLRYVADDIDYTEPPAEPIGYEYPGSKISFEDFKKAIESVG